MKLTESRLRQIINQEAHRTLSETKHVSGGGGRLKVSYDYDGGCIAVDAGSLRGNVELVQKVLDSYHVDRDELKRVLSKIGIEDVEAEGEIISVDEFIDSF
jgi:hypothetical protein